MKVIENNYQYKNIVCEWFKHEDADFAAQCIFNVILAKPQKSPVL